MTRMSIPAFTSQHVIATYIIETSLPLVHAAEVLQKEGLWDPNEHDFTPMIGMDLVYAPMETYLTPAAQQVWHRLHDGSKASARKARRTIRKGELNLYDWNEKGFDPWV